MSNSSMKMLFNDSNDLLLASQSVMPIVRENLPGGDISGIRIPYTYGPVEYFHLVDNTVLNLWIEVSQCGHMGFGLGLISLTLATRLFFLPLDTYNQVSRIKMAVLKPALDECSAEARKNF